MAKPGVYLNLSTFLSAGGSRKYIWIDRKTGIRLNLLNQSFKDEATCLKTLKEVVDPKIEEIKRNYK